MKLDYKQLFAVFIILTFIAPLIGLFLQPGTITGDVAYADAVGGFKDTNRTAVFENGSLIVWLFGTTTCPHTYYAAISPKRSICRPTRPSKPER